MKLRLLSSFLGLAFLLFYSTNINAQLEITNLEHLEALKNTTTIVFMPAADTAKHLKYRKILEEYWNLTPLKFISYNQYVKHKNKDGYSYLLFGDDQVSNGTTTSSYVYLELWMWENAEASSGKKKQLARIDLYPDPETTYNPALIYDYRFDTDGHIFNWSAGLLKNYLQMIQNYLEKGKKRTQYLPETNPENLIDLCEQKLYVPAYCLQNFNGALVETGKQSCGVLMQKYSYEYEMIESQQLSDKILNSTDPFYYLLFVRSNADKYIAVVEAQSGKIIYSRFRPISYNLKPNDLKRLNKAIEKAKSR
jgi:hypothetical protein